ncbi:glycosyltransferase [Sphingomonas gilva]|uniref:Glycosyltransferase n=1 Tax=Sphingomonas gilva TaxID=2305907 RepID=A0A396RKA5_9SPHN|nr:glycosyltransferase [Sphingomonas gilva]RHW16664.1 glycosyltransferase [Sphingomonas gilva]
MNEAPACRIAILLPDMRGGGVERVRTELAAEFLARGCAVDFVLMQRRGELLDKISPGARTIDLDARRLTGAIRPLAAYLRRERPTALLAAMWPLTSIAILANCLAGRPSRMVVSDHNTLSSAYAGRGPIHRAMLRGSLAATYPLADGRIAVSQGVADDLADLSGMRADRFAVVHNPLVFGDDDGGEAVSWPRGEGARILSVGRLKSQKNHRLLIDAFAIARRRRPMQLMILGEGDQRPALEEHVRSLGIEKQVALPGFFARPHSAYREADMFVLSSDYEGFGNVLVEALSFGLRVVSTDCPSGPADILGHGKFGRLAPCGDPDALADAMLAQLDAPHDPDRQRARSAQFTTTAAADAYLRLLMPAGNAPVHGRSRAPAISGEDI